MLEGSRTWSYIWVQEKRHETCLSLSSPFRNRAMEDPKLEGWEMVALGGLMGNSNRRQDYLLAPRRGDFGWFFLCSKWLIFSSVQSLSRVGLFATPWTAACQASLSITNSWSLLKLLSVESVMLSNHSSSVVPFSSCLQSFPASGSFQMSQFSASGLSSVSLIYTLNS